MLCVGDRSGRRMRCGNTPSTTTCLATMLEHGTHLRTYYVCNITTLWPTPTGGRRPSDRNTVLPPPFMHQNVHIHLCIVKLTLTRHRRLARRVYEGNVPRPGNHIGSYSGGVDMENLLDHNNIMLSYGRGTLGRTDLQQIHTAYTRINVAAH